MYQFTEQDIETICSWVPSTRILKLVSSNVANCLTPHILQEWMACAVNVLTINDGEPRAFCTLSVSEVSNLPESYVEVCHLLADPAAEYIRNGNLILSYAVSVAKRLGYNYACGRVRPDNSYGLRLVRACFEEFDDESWLLPEFRWFRANLMQLCEVSNG